MQLWKGHLKEVEGIQREKHIAMTMQNRLLLVGSLVSQLVRWWVFSGYSEVSSHRGFWTGWVFH